jgi:homopolymeric O-antigen transport system permease protein
VTGTQLEPRQKPAASADESAEPASGHGYVSVIQPPSRWPRLDLHELWRFRELLGVFVWRDLKVRYKQTFIGGAWALLQPILTTAVYTVIFGKFAKFPADHLPYPLFAFASVLAWQYFASATLVASGSLVANVGLITKVYFPRILVPLAAVVTPLVDFVLGLFVLVGLMAWYDIWPGPAAILAPLFLLLAFATALGTSLILSALNVRYRDVPFVIPVFMQVLTFLSGVQYSLDGISPTWRWLLSLNPMTAVVSGWRWGMLDGPAPVPGQLAVGVGVGLLLLAAGVAFFKRAEPRFADTI